MSEKSTFVQLAVLLSAVWLLTYADTGAACDDASSKKDVKITYGDSHLSVDTKQKPVKHDDWLVFDLKPDMQIGPPPGDVDFTLDRRFGHLRRHRRPTEGLRAFGSGIPDLRI